MNALIILKAIYPILLFAILLSSFYEVKAQTPLKESPVLQLNEDSWQSFHEHDGVEFSGQLGNCDNRQIAILKFVNRTPNRKEVRISFLNGNKRLGSQIILLQPAQELLIDCKNSMSFQLTFLVDGTSLKIETLVISLK